MEETEDELMGLLGEMTSEDIDEFTDWLTEKGNEDFLFTMLQIMDKQLVEKYNEDEREKQQILGALGQIESLAVEVEQMEEQRQQQQFEQELLKRSGYVPAHFIQHAPMVLAREGNLDKRFLLW